MTTIEETAVTIPAPSEAEMVHWACCEGPDRHGALGVRLCDGGVEPVTGRPAGTPACEDCTDAFHAGRCPLHGRCPWKDPE